MDRADDARECPACESVSGEPHPDIPVMHRCTTPDQECRVTWFFETYDVEDV